VDIFYLTLKTSQNILKVSYAYFMLVISASLLEVLDFKTDYV